ncbi:MAG: DUF459 domain-containing protein [Bauldia sp.]|nr:DUF459 domain-containing protein [Bauldia sp.]
MARRLVLLLLVALLSAGFVATDFGATFSGDPSALAASKKKDRPGIFDRLFGSKDEPRAAQPPRNSSPSKRRILPTRKKTTTPTRNTSRKTSSGVAVVNVDEKDPNARRILIIGDFVGDGIAWGLDQALAREPKLAVIKEINAPSGLVRQDTYDWNKELLGVLNQENPDMVVVSLGVNDRQDLRVDKDRYPVRSEEWLAAYEQRVDAVTDTLKVYGRPFFWVSAPPLRGEDATSDMAFINGLIEPRVTKAGGHFIDVWNGFTNASGQYITTGPDIEGQVKALRTSDGINFTSVGKQKLAYYVERDIRRSTGMGAGTVELVASSTQASTIEIGLDGKKRLVGPVISLSDPPPGASLTLAGAPPPVVYDPISGQVMPAPADPLQDAVTEAETAQYRLVVKGESLATLPGRVDDFAWPPSQRQNQSFQAPPAEGDAADESAEAASDEATAETAAAN